MTHTPIPCKAAKAIAETYHKSLVVIIGYDPESGRMHTTTFGVDAADKEAAARFGEKVTRAVGGVLSLRQIYEDFHHDPDRQIPARYRAATELLADIQTAAVLPSPLYQRVESFLEPERKPR